jgi:repressor LexA
LEERGFLRRLAHRARALEVIKLPQQATPAAPAKGRAPFKPQLVDASSVTPTAANDTRELPILGKIAAGTPIEAIQQERDRIQVPESILGAGEHFVLDGDFVVIRRSDSAASGDIVVALIQGEEATLKRLRKKGASIALEAANPAYETRIFGPDQVAVQGKLVGLIRRYH